MYFSVINPTYVEWKNTKTSLALTAYYVKYDMHYVALLIDKVNGNIFRIDISRDGKDANVADFEATIKPGATLKNDIETAVADAIN